MTGTLDNYMLIAEIDASAMTAAQPWLTLDISSSGTSGVVMIIAVLEPRYAGESSVTALT